MTGINPMNQSLLTKPSLLNAEDKTIEHPLVDVDQSEQHKGDSNPLLSRKKYFDEVDGLKKFEYRDVFKKATPVRDSKLQSENYEQEFNDNKSKRLMNTNKLSWLTDLFMDDADNMQNKLSESNKAKGQSSEITNGEQVSGVADYAVNDEGVSGSGLATTEAKSSKEFCEEIARMIGETKTDYLEVYEKILEKYIGLFKDLSDILSQLPNLIDDGKDNKITVDAGKLKALLEALKTKYQNQVLYPTESGKKASKSEAEDWAEKLGLPASCVQPDGSSGYVVKFDLSPIDEMLNGLGAVSNGEISSAKYQAWKAGFDAQVEKINNYVQTLSQKYTTANSTYDNLVKVLSSTITSMYDADKEYLKN